MSFRPAHQPPAAPFAGASLFASYAHLPEQVPPWVWIILRCLGVSFLLGTTVAGFLAPTMSLMLFWGLVVPLTPLVFLIAPGFWRNVCPLATLNQIPRTLGFTRARSLPRGVQQYAPFFSAGLFFVIVPLRKVLLDQHGVALAALLLAVLSLAFAGGLLFKGKSGWCSQFCPLLQVERFYGQSPLLVVRDDHCRPCIGCARNCYDANPTAAYLRDLHDTNLRLALHRKLFAGAMPWFIVAFFALPSLTTISITRILALYGQLLLFVIAGMVLLLILEVRSPFTSYQLILGHAMAAINLFYWFVAPLALRQLGVSITLLPHLIQAGVLAISLLWLRRALPRERAFLSKRVPNASSAGHRQRKAQVQSTATPA
jgi:hypothetical protein